MPLVDLEAIPQAPLDFVDADHREEARLLDDLAEAVTAVPAWFVNHIMTMDLMTARLVASRG